MEDVKTVSIIISFVPDKSNGYLTIKIDSSDFNDSVIVLASAMYRDNNLRMMVKGAIEFLASSEFKEVAQKEGL